MQEVIAKALFPTAVFRFNSAFIDQKVVFLGKSKLY
jgi:hypothetical protein